MIKNLIASFFLLCVSSLFAQTQSFSYQAVVRDASGVLVVNSDVSFRTSIVKDALSGTTVYSEEHSVETSSYGSVALAIGKGTATLGRFDTINWSSSNYYVNIAYDIEGGSNYVDAGTSQLLSVPYALHSLSSSSNPVLENRISELEQILLVERQDFDEDGFTIRDGDCNDSLSTVYPRAVDFCGDGLDNDCDGLIDSEDENCQSNDFTPSKIPAINAVYGGLSIRQAGPFGSPAENDVLTFDKIPYNKSLLVTISCNCNSSVSVPASGVRDTTNIIRSFDLTGNGGFVSNGSGLLRPSSFIVKPRQGPSFAGNTIYRIDPFGFFVDYSNTTFSEGDYYSAKIPLTLIYSNVIGQKMDYTLTVEVVNAQ